MSEALRQFPESDIDLFRPDALLDPYPLYEELRAIGPAVWLSRLGVFAIPRYEEVRAVGHDADTFSSLGLIEMPDEEVGDQLNTQ